MTAKTNVAIDSGDRNAICAVSLRLEIGDTQVLLIKLCRNGEFERLAGSVDTGDFTLHKTTGAVESFDRIRARITPRLLEMCAPSRSELNPRGKICDLSICFERSEGEELAIRRRYGSDSRGVAPEILALVDAMMQIPMKTAGDPVLPVGKA